MGGWCGYGLSHVRRRPAGGARGTGRWHRITTPARGCATRRRPPLAHRPSNRTAGSRGRPTLLPERQTPYSWTRCACRKTCARSASARNARWRARSRPTSISCVGEQEARLEARTKRARCRQTVKRGCAARGCAARGADWGTSSLSSSTCSKRSLVHPPWRSAPRAGCGLAQSGARQAVPGLTAGCADGPAAPCSPAACPQPSRRRQQKLHWAGEQVTRSLKASTATVPAGRRKAGPPGREWRRRRRGCGIGACRAARRESMQSGAAAAWLLAARAARGRPRASCNMCCMGMQPEC